MQGSPVIPKPLEERYVKLKPEYTRYLTWSNDPRDFDLNVHFSQDPPNLSSDFKVNSLRPIIREPPEDGDTILMKDAKGTYYMWDERDGHLLRVKDEWTKGPDLTKTRTL
jgi:hypothetical protein